MAADPKNTLGQNWEAHEKTFGPILEPAFSEDPQGRSRLCQALDHIKRKEMTEGRAILQQLNDCCRCNADRAALAFCQGLSYELTRQFPQMIHWYETAERFGHRFFLPHLKLAQTYHNGSVYDNARKHYEIAIEYLKASDHPNREIIGSAYVNLCSCLTMMHLYTDGKKAFAQAENYPLQPASYGVAAMLYAASFEPEQVNHYLSLLKQANPVLAERSDSVVQQIFQRKHPHFFRVTVSELLLAAFWNWFRDNQQTLREDAAHALPQLAKSLKHTFPFLGREPNLHLAKSPEGMKLTLHDCYSVGLHHGYGALLRCCPEDILKHWAFTIVH